MTHRHPSRNIEIQRAYDATPGGKAYRVLVDRFWPRGLRKADLQPDLWARDLAPTRDLIKWFGHDPARWAEFRARYMDELDAEAARQGLRDLLAEAGSRDIILLYGARDPEHNQAVVLRDALQRFSSMA
ncbi:DUF488 domain-containing protein [Bordetella bronchialis]|uniref:MarR family transcriptional regulator n=1 Tax=Bordetella bronchialis TaxID=463025 RepID=A0A193FV99_9BORD|nr:DUF488 family protein [Bordetella bronchialis]ANN71106.1 hypothetical protein BAU08_06935 [Bordetella bronchialis]